VVFLLLKDLGRLCVATGYSGRACKHEIHLPLQTSSKSNTVFIDFSSAPLELKSGSSHLAYGLSMRPLPCGL
jgi:hypothetical protein